MHIVIATPLYPPDIGGPATYTRLLEQGFLERGSTLEVVKFSDVRHLPKIVRHYAYYRRVLRAAQKADVILALDPVSVGLPALFAAKKVRKPLVVKVVGDYAWEQGQQRYGVSETLDEFVRLKRVPLLVRFLQYLQSSVARAATHIIVPSQYLKRIVATWGVSSEKITVIYNSIALLEIKMPDKRPEGFLVVSSGRRVPWKGFEALSRVVSLDSSWNLFIASDLSRAETLGWVKSADVFVLNSSYEGLSHALIEAMMLGTPVIATNVGGNPELVEDRVTGLLIPRTDEALLEALTDVEQGRDVARKRASVAQERMRQFDTDIMLSTTHKFLNSL